MLLHNLNRMEITENVTTISDYDQLLRIKSMTTTPLLFLVSPLKKNIILGEVTDSGPHLS